MGNQVIGGTGGGACPGCGQFAPNCHCIEEAQRLAASIGAEACRYEYKTRYVDGRGADYETDDTESTGGWKRVWADITMQGAFIVYRRERT